jgi:penicillin-binding protein 2
LVVFGFGCVTTNEAFAELMWFKRRQSRVKVRDTAAELALIQRRYQVLVVFVLLLLALLAYRFAHLQIIDHELYVGRAENNRVSLRALPPTRGLIYDRKGRVLAENRPAYRLVVVPERVPDLEATLAAIDDLIGLSEDDRIRFERQRQRSRRFQSIPLKNNLKPETVSRLAAHRHRLPGVDVEPYLTRHYPYGEMFAHVLGYVGRIDIDDAKRLGPERYRATTHIGRVGIEQAHETALHGDPGVEKVETNAQGRVVRVLDRQDPVHGQDLHLTLDLDWQRAAVDALSEQAGAIVVLEIETGAVRALVSQPAFDPNGFVNGISDKDYRALLDNPRQPLFNRFLKGEYEPGSTIKPFLALAGLSEGVINADDKMFSQGWFELDGEGRRYRDWRRGGHGWVDLKKALAESVNVYFYELAVSLGITRMAKELALFGFGQPTGIDLLGEGDGLLPTISWKRAVYGEAWFPGETVITGIGQGFVVATPLQLAHATAILAGRGRSPAPYLVTPSAPMQRVAHDEADWAAVFEGMIEVINGPTGTARAVASQVPVGFAGKTGTAQVFGLPDEVDAVDEREQETLPEHLRNHALFIGFAPADQPKWVISVVVEHGGGGASVAAPIGAEVMAEVVR